MEIILCVLLIAGAAGTESGPHNELLALPQQRMSKVIRSRGNWASDAAELSRALSIRVVSHARLESGPPYTGTVRGFLERMEMEGCQLSVLPQLLCIAPAPQSFIMSASDLKSRKVTYDHPVQELVVSFIEEQRNRIARGGSIRAVELSQQQLESIRKLFAMRRKAEEFAFFLKSGEVSCFVSEVSTVLFKHGMAVEAMDVHKSTEAKGELKDHNKPVDGTRKRFLGDLLPVAREVWLRSTNANVRIPQNQTMTLGQAIRLLPPPSQGREASVSRALIDTPLIVTAGQYSVYEFASAIAFASNTEFRKVSSQIHLAPRIHTEQARATSDTEVFWKALEPVLTAAVNNPRSSFAPFDRQQALKMALVPVLRLTKPQLESVAAQNRVTVAYLSNATNDECLVTPMIECRLSYTDATGTKKWFGNGFTPRLDYQWAVLNSRRARNQVSGDNARN